MKTRYPRWLLIAFVRCTAILVICVCSLLLSPLFASTSIVAILLFVIFFALEGLVLIIRRAELYHKDKET